MNAIQFPFKTTIYWVIPKFYAKNLKQSLTINKLRNHNMNLKSKEKWLRAWSLEQLDFTVHYKGTYISSTLRKELILDGTWIIVERIFNRQFLSI